MENKEIKKMVKTWEELGKAFEKASELLKEGYQKSFWFRCWVRWDNFRFIIGKFFKDILPNFIGYIIYKIKHPKHSFVVWRK